jgi:hypothetical protein
MLSFGTGQTCPMIPPIGARVKPLGVGVGERRGTACRESTAMKQKGSPAEAAPAFGYYYFSTSTTYLRITLANLSRWGAMSVQAFDL